MRTKNILGVAIALVVVTVGLGSGLSLYQSHNQSRVMGETTQITASTNMPEVIADPNVIEYDGQVFNPSRLTLAADQPVTIVNSSKNEIVLYSYLLAPGGIEVPKNLPSGGTITHIFTEPGQFEYYAGHQSTVKVFIEVTK